MPQNDLVDASDSAFSSLSLGFYTVGWPIETFQNGVVTSVSTLAPTLRAMGHRVTIVAARTAEGFSDDSVYSLTKAHEGRGKARRVLDGACFRVAPHWATKQFVRRYLLAQVRRAVAERRIQLFEMEESFGSARWVGKVIPVPICVRLHGPWFLNGSITGAPDDHKYRERVRDEGRAIRTAAAVTAPSRNVLDQVRNFYKLALPEAEIIPAPTWPVPANKRWRLEECDPNQVLFIGRFDRHKGGDQIIEAFGRVLQAIPEARLRFVGPDRGYIATDGRKWGIQDFIRDRIPGALETNRVEWLGQAPQPYPMLAQLRRGAMVTVVCSRYENFPLTVVEAMAVGCPIVAASAGGITEIIQDGVNGLLHRAGDPEDLAVKIIQTLKNPARSAEFGHQAAADCERLYYPDVVVNRLIEFYRHVLAKWPATTRARFPHQNSH
jgi:glycosyltransferase involved in cell wall biosynthesis